MASGRFVAQHGMNSQTGAVQHLIRTAVGAAIGGAVGRRKKKMSSRVSGKARRRTTRSAKGKRSPALSRQRNRGLRRRNRVQGRLIKGSAAAKRYMAKLRRMRK